MRHQNPEGSVEVKQGPEWLVELAIDPPLWIYPSIIAVAGVTIALAYLGYQRNGGLDDKVLREMGEIGTIVFSIAAVSKLWSETLTTPYLVDVVCGTIIGFCIARYLILAERKASVTRA